MDILEAGLANFALAWILSFWHKTERLREWFGVYFITDKQGYNTDRLDGGGLGGWLNCPACASVLSLPLAWLLRKPLASLGLALILVRWWESTRTKAEWWL